MSDLRERFTDAAWEEMEKMYEITDFESVEQLAEHILEQRVQEPEEGDDG